MPMKPVLHHTAIDHAFVEAMFPVGSLLPVADSAQLRTKIFVSPGQITAHKMQEAIFIMIGTGARPERTDDHFTGT
jgi:hypothetical protein